VTWQGTETSNHDFPGGTSIWAGVHEAITSSGGTAVLSLDGSFDEKPDVAIVVFGESPYAETEGDRQTLEHRVHRPRDLKLLRRLSDAGIPVVSVLLSGRPMWVNPELNASQAFVAAWLPGSEGGGIADLLFKAPDGATAQDFAGKLSFSWPRSPDQHELNRHDPAADPLFSYGFGLSYGDDVELPPLPES